jgi:predicted GH43/DUF377 family glycosyl hydrolase
MLAHRHDAVLGADPSRVIARLFLPGEELHQTRSRTSQIVERVMAFSEDEVSALVPQLVTNFADRHRHYEQLLTHHASIVATHVGTELAVSPGRTLLLGASFTAEYATEGAALCNPSAIRHPDQSALGAGQVRLAISLRGIGEGHLSSIAFASAVVGPDGDWAFEPREPPATTGTVTPAQWSRPHLRAVLADQGPLDELGRAVLSRLPTRFSGSDLELALSEVQRDLRARTGAAATVELIRRLVSSAYVVEFDAATRLTQRVLLPAAVEESNGMEDARFTRFVDDNDNVEYRATYTAYDGQQIAPRLLTSPDLRTFHAHRLAGAAARNKGMALFPRPVGGRHLALCRSDGESTGLTSSVDGRKWSAPDLVQVPRASWEVLQVGNCGPPIETERGWFVLTHGVGPMRTYSIGALLLDLDDPRRVLGRLERPFLEPSADERDGYVPNVVYSCGGYLHEKRLWLPYGIADARIGVAWADLDEVLDAMRPVPDSGRDRSGSRHHRRS